MSMKFILDNHIEEYELHLQNRLEKEIDVKNIQKINIEYKSLIREEQLIRSKIKSLSSGVESRDKVVEYKDQLKVVLAKIAVMKKKLND